MDHKQAKKAIASAGVDVGHFSTKMAIARSEESVWTELFPSIVVDASETDTFQWGGKSDVVQTDVGGLQMLAGKDIHSFAGLRSAPRKTDEEFIESDRYMALFKTALHYIAKSEAINHDFEVGYMVVGLPLTTIRAKFARLSSITQGTHDTYGADGKTPIRVSIKRCEVMAQPHGGLTYHSLAHGLEIQEDSSALVMDMGGGTFDWLVADHNLAPRYANCGAEPVGAWKFLGQVAANLTPEWEGDADMIKMIDKHIRSNKRVLRIGQTTYDLDAAREKAYPVFRQAVLKMLSKVGNTSKMDFVLLTGGGASHFKEAVNLYAPQFSKKLTIDTDPVFSNVKGYALVAANR